MARLIYVAVGLLLLATGCDWDGRQQRAEAERAEAALRTAVEAVREAGEALSAEQEKVFRPTAEQSAYLEAFTAVGASGSPNGFFTNQDGVSGYFQGYDRPFNFIWTGGTAEFTAFDGQTYRVISGPGELLLKYHDDALLLQRSKGEFKDGLRHGYGEVWSRNRAAGGHNYQYYRGGFADDRMNGRGVYVDYNLSGRGEHPYKYEGGMKDDEFHGQGLTTDLASGGMRYKGLWLEGRRFSGSLEDWRVGNEWSELNSVERQYKKALMTGELVLSGFINHKPGEGALTVFMPQDFENALMVDQNGRSYPLDAVRLPDGKTGGGPEEMVNVAILEAPLSAYPLTLTLSYGPENRRQHFQVTVKRPFGLILTEGSPAEKPDGGAADSRAD